MLHFYHSNHIEVLAKELANKIKQQPLNDPFAKEYIIVQSKGMERWLSMTLAQHLGITANIEYPFPDSMLWKLMYWSLDNLPEQSYYKREVILWSFMTILSQNKQNPQFQEINNYLQDDKTGNKQFQLAWRLANLYDQYVVYRPHWIRDWENDLQPRVLGMDRQANWQASLWRVLNQYYGHTQHKAKLRSQLFHKLSNGLPLNLQQKLPSRISVFGIAALPPFYIEVFTQLSQWTDIHFFLFNPCQEYWGDIVSDSEIAHQSVEDGKPVAPETLYFEKGNSLLASMGKLGRDFSKLLLELSDEQAKTYPKFIEIPESNLLTTIQADILHLRERGLDIPAMWIGQKDKSLQIHVCHSPMREVEVLYDQLLNLFDQDKNLLPKDIVVMMPNVEKYVPFIEAVFGTVVDDKAKIPFSITDRSLRNESILIDAFFAILELCQSRFGVNEVLAVLDHVPIQRQFKLTSADLALIRHWVIETNIRWGVDAKSRENMELPAYKDNTWREGLQKMLIGYVLPAQNEYLFSGLLPYDDIEGSDGLILGRFIHFMETLFTTVDILETDRTLLEWRTFILDLVEQFIFSNEETLSQLQQIRNVLDRLVNLEGTGESQLAGFNQPVSFSVIFAYLKQYLDAEPSPLHFLTGGMTFCALLPMRSIPFKVVCLLGMNDNDYPRGNQPLSFDLINHYPLRGDRSRRNNDRYLFLEALLSSRQCFYISYIGHNINDNSELPPSVLVSELLDYVQKGFKHPKNAILDEIITHHPLQAFSPKYFSGEHQKLFSYSNEYCTASHSMFGERELYRPFIEMPLHPTEITTLELEQLIRFFTHPTKYLLRHGLGILLPQAEGFIEESEPFELDFLTRYLLGNLLVEKGFLQHDLNEFQPIIRATGQLPYGEVGEHIYSQLQVQAESFIESIQEYSQQKKLDTASVIIDLPNRVQLIGNLPNLWEKQQLQYRCSKLKAKDFIKLWLQHLLLNAAKREDLPKHSILIGTDKQFKASPVLDSYDILAQLVQIYQDGLKHPLAFFPESAMKFVETVQNPKKGEQKALQAAIQSWQGSQYARGECLDPYYELCFANDVTLPVEQEAFKLIAQQFYAPLLKYVKQ
ncbi:exodeoxyribonuclease V subunit gamma [Candidatus Albibeggiatoa sp. nov. NOAA]|uniref:exodeoxyribonuclease V subunit gamma n=1 Tax=Candidatus Albibeggiatoa sp. nov. NOAA TaxID=3162724 RepID=UPI00330382A3|nr:exodeoxyribonuclease V subunit gamma [Thiotrichaceae bacterium]